MWPFRRKPPTPTVTPTRYGTTALQTGDDCVCVSDNPHSFTHQKLLTKGAKYVVREVALGRNPNGYGGPFVKLVGIVPINDESWDADRFEKVVKKTILDKVSEPAGLDVEKEREGAY